jgi:hypothetical protein
MVQDNEDKVSLRYQEILRGDLYREMMRRCITVDLDELYSYSIKELEIRLSKLVDW